jgi:hypothetical protein
MMNLGACSSLRTGPETAVWYRAVQTAHWPTALSTAQTVLAPSRFSPARAAAPGYPVLYLAENHLVALYEVEAIIGSTWPGGVLLSAPLRAWIILNVRVVLQRVADLCEFGEQMKLDTTAQELTGDWRGYLFRSPLTPVTGPTGPAPTQDLGQALYQIPGLEGFRTPSARWPTHRNLVVFPDKLGRGSSIVFSDPATGQSHTIQP